MSATPDSTLANPEQLIADLQRQLAESEAQKAAMAEVLGVINASPGDLTPVFDAILQKAHTLCGVAYGGLAIYDDEHFRMVATRGYPEEVAETSRRPFRGNAYHRQLVLGERNIHITFGTTHLNEACPRTTVIPLRFEAASSIRRSPAGSGAKSLSSFRPCGCWLPSRLAMMKEDDLAMFKGLPFIYHDKSLGELDWNGKVVWQWGANAPGGAAQQHHDWARLPSGNTLVLSVVVHPLPGFALPKLVDDAIYEVTPKGDIVWRWVAGDHLDEFGWTPEELALVRATKAISYLHTTI